MFAGGLGRHFFRRTRLPRLASFSGSSTNAALPITSCLRTRRHANAFSSSKAAAASHKLRISYPDAAAERKPVAVFTAGAPGSGKTYCLHSMYDASTVETIDLDIAMTQHEQFDVEHPEALYASRVAYDWANAKVEERFQEVLRGEAGVERAPITCIDGTGTHVKRQIRRLRQAKEAGFWTVKLYVQVSLETALERNSRRERQVPREVLETYTLELDEAVKEVVASGFVDEYIEFNNDGDDGKDGRTRWGDAYDDIWAKSVERSRRVKFQRRGEMSDPS